MRISDWSSDVCSSDLAWVTASTIAFLFGEHPQHEGLFAVTTVRNKISSEKRALVYEIEDRDGYPCVVFRAQRSKISAEELVQASEIGRASCRERVCQYV